MDHVVRRRAYARRAGEICACVATLVVAGCAKDAMPEQAPTVGSAVTAEGAQGTRAKGEEEAVDPSRYLASAQIDEKPTSAPPPATPRARALPTPRPSEPIARGSDPLSGAHGFADLPMGASGAGPDRVSDALAAKGYAQQAAGGGGGGLLSGRAYSSVGGTAAGTVAPSTDNAAHAMRILPRLDPNARYATTYRPGGAALAAFDAAVARGSIPASYKDLAGDFGARYAPALAKPEGKRALTFQIETERTEIAPGGGTLNLRIAMRSSDAMPPRAPLSVHLVLDVSGSMSGAAIENARSAAETLVERLDARDDFSMVTFSSDAQVLVPDGAIGPRRAAVIEKIRHVAAEGGTNISAGLDLGYIQAHTRSIDPNAVKIVMLLSDGHANGGDTNSASLAERSGRAFQDGVQTSSFGLGADFDAPLMSAIADRGAGGYYYLADSTQIAPALSRELDARLVPAAQGVEVRVRLRPDVSPVKIFGSHILDGAEAANVRRQGIAVDRNVKRHDGIAQDRQDDAAGGMRFFMPAFARDDRHAMLLTLVVPPGAGERAIASVEVKYKDRLRMQNVTDEIPVKVRYAASDIASAGSLNPSVAATAQAFAAGETILTAAGSVDRADRREASRILVERSEILRRAADQLHEPKLAEDGTRLARLSQAVMGDGQVADNLPLAVLLRGSGYGYLR